MSDIINKIDKVLNEDMQLTEAKIDSNIESAMKIVIQKLLKRIWKSTDKSSLDEVAKNMKFKGLFNIYTNDVYKFESKLDGEPESFEITIKSEN